ncbi:2TM domain-containing protein [Gilvibacter sp. SZ-19]|uniref:2TM domain-containing protein n=1 Tax=unclassified Gilvibacter TaxID=2625242 RepID=UPI000B3BFB3A|nr:2TM domain-containing protein [Gilvibacter sp. SZ-19]ARV10997.1 histidine kinase [Gilvibacter sp. SZ-19]
MNRFFKEAARGFGFGIVIFIVLMIISYLLGWRMESFGELLTEFTINQIYSVTLFVLNGYIISYYLQKHRKNFFKAKNLTQSILSSLGATIGAIVIIRLFIHSILEGKPIREFLASEKPEYYMVALLITVVMLTIYYTFYYYKSTRDSQVKEQKKIAGSAAASFDALKNQLDPHFLFNSLNVLTSLIEENPKAATKFTTSLSKVYRYVLEQKNKDLVTLQEELEFAQLYMSLLKMRFEDSIEYNTPQQLENPEAKVVPLSLQLLLENAVKHNMVTPSKRLIITIYEQDGALVVKNNIQPKQVVKKSSGVGLQNIRQRYQLLTDRPVLISELNNEFVVALPLLTKQKATTMNVQEEFINEKRYLRAQERVEKIKGFYVHFSIYLIFVPIFIYLNLKSTDFPWALFPIGGWGLGVIGHAMEVFNYNPLLGKNWEERKIREFMDKDDF